VFSGTLSYAFLKSSGFTGFNQGLVSPLKGFLGLLIIVHLEKKRGRNPLDRDPSIIPLEAATGFEEVHRVIRDKNPRFQLTCARHIKSHSL
jgi:hypothetical protein